MRITFQHISSSTFRAKKADPASGTIVTLYGRCQDGSSAAVHVRNIKHHLTVTYTKHVPIAVLQVWLKWMAQKRSCEFSTKPIVSDKDLWLLTKPIDLTETRNKGHNIRKVHLPAQEFVTYYSRDNDLLQSLKKCLIRLEKFFLEKALVIL